MAELNQLGPGPFAQALRSLFEAAEPLAAALHAQRPFDSYPELLARAEALADQLTLAEQAQVLDAHPRIGESGDTIKHTSALSYREQGYDREAPQASDELERVYVELAVLNEAYEQRFGFRFVVFVNGRPKSEILEVLRERMHSSRDAERQAGLSAMFSIARDRLQRFSE